jgi:hypothetical protein
MLSRRVTRHSICQLPSAQVCGECSRCYGCLASPYSYINPYALLSKTLFAPMPSRPLSLVFKIATPRLNDRNTHHLSPVLGASNNSATMSTSPATLDSGISASRRGKANFMSLSGEIRKMIYAYALTEERGLHYGIGPERVARLYLNNKPYKELRSYELEEANQLRYVNKQLYVETRGLGLRYNTVKFIDFADAAAFLQDYPQAAQRLQGMHISNYESNIASRDLQWQRPATRLVLSFLRENPHLPAKLALECASPNKPATLPTVMLYEMQFKQTTHILDRFYADESREEALHTCMDILQSPYDMAELDTTKAIFPPNLRFVLGDERFKRAVLEHNGRHAFAMSMDCMHHVRNGFDGWAETTVWLQAEGV